jgi:hypothetical protein
MQELSDMYTLREWRRRRRRRWRRLWMYDVSKHESK